MTEKQKPAYKGKLDVALWEKQDKNGKTFYTVSIGNICNVFENPFADEPVAPKRQPAKVASKKRGERK